MLTAVGEHKCCMSACRNREVITREHVKSTFRTVISINKQMAETSGGLCVTRVPGPQQVTCVCVVPGLWCSDWWAASVTLQLHKKNTESLFNSSNFTWNRSWKWRQQLWLWIQASLGSFGKHFGINSPPLVLFLWLCCLQMMKNTAGLKVRALLCDNPIPLSWGVVVCGR